MFVDANMSHGTWLRKCSKCVPLAHVAWHVDVVCACSVRGMRMMQLLMSEMTFLLCVSLFVSDVQLLP